MVIRYWQESPMKIRKAFPLALVVAGALVGPLSYLHLHAQDAHADTGRELLPDATLPFTLEQVLAYFGDAFGKPPRKINDQRFVFVDRDYADDSTTITVSALGQKLGIVLLATGDFGVNRLREFFEAPFFLRSESEQLYALLDQGRGIRSAEVGRFHVRISVSETRAWIVVAMEFRPPGDVTGPG